MLGYVQILTPEPFLLEFVPPMTNNVVTQIVRLANSAHGQKPLLLRIKVDFVVNGQQITDTAEVANFPEGV